MVLTDKQVKNFEEEMFVEILTASKDPENLMHGLTQDGDIPSWSMVDADVYMAMHLKYPELKNLSELYYSFFDTLVDRVIAINAAK